MYDSRQEGDVPGGVGRASGGQGVTVRPSDVGRSKSRVSNIDERRSKNEPKEALYEDPKGSRSVSRTGKSLVAPKYAFDPNYEADSGSDLEDERSLPERRSTRRETHRSKSETRRPTQRDDISPKQTSFRNSTNNPAQPQGSGSRVVSSAVPYGDPERSETHRPTQRSVKISAPSDLKAKARASSQDQYVRHGRPTSDYTFEKPRNTKVRSFQNNAVEEANQPIFDRNSYLKKSVAVGESTVIDELYLPQQQLKRPTEQNRLVQTEPLEAGTNTDSSDPQRFSFGQQATHPDTPANRYSKVDEQPKNKLRTATQGNSKSPTGKHSVFSVAVPEDSVLPAFPRTDRFSESNIRNGSKLADPNIPSTSPNNRQTQSKQTFVENDRIEEENYFPKMSQPERYSENRIQSGSKYSAPPQSQFPAAEKRSPSKSKPPKLAEEEEYQDKHRVSALNYTKPDDRSSSQNLPAFPNPERYSQNDIRSGPEFNSPEYNNPRPSANKQPYQSRSLAHDQPSGDPRYYRPSKNVNEIQYKISAYSHPNESISDSDASPFVQNDQKMSFAEQPFTQPSAGQNRQSRAPSSYNSPNESPEWTKNDSGAEQGFHEPPRPSLQSRTSNYPRNPSKISRASQQFFQKLTVTNAPPNTKPNSPEVADALETIDQFITKNRLTALVDQALYNVEDEEFVIKFNPEVLHNPSFFQRHHVIQQDDVIFRKFKLVPLHLYSQSDADQIVKRREIIRTSVS